MNETLSQFAIIKALLVLNFITYVTQIFKAYCINGYLGPKVFMLKRMIRDLVMFVLVFFVFYVSYSVSYHAFFKKNDSSYPSIIKVGIWEIFGSVEEDEILGQSGKSGCYLYYAANHSGAEEPEHGIHECEIREGFIMFLLIVYLFCTSILLVNMLIATFTHTFENIQRNSKQIWKYQMYFLVEEYRTKPILPEPLMVFEHLFLIARHFFRKFISRAKLVPLDEISWEIPLDKKDKHFLNVFESACRTDYLERKKKKCCEKCGSVQKNARKKEQ